MTYDIAIIGGGPGGYTCADKAAKAGLKTVLFEKAFLGGTCLNRGCMPTKSLLHSAETYTALKHAADLGVNAGDVGYDFGVMHQKKNEVVEKLRQGVAQLMKAGKIDVIEGQARVEGPGKISCNGELYEAADIVVATGSKIASPPIPGKELPGVYSSNDLLIGDGVPFDSLIIIGGGVVGTECASIYLALGAQVTILEAADHILPLMDKEIAQRLALILKKQGGKVEAKAFVSKIEGEPGNMSVTWTDKKGNEQVSTAQGVLLAAGRIANTDDLFAPGAEPELEKGAILADELGRTSVEHLYVIGDAKAHNIQLAHVAEAQGTNMAALLAGKEPPMDMRVVPNCVYTTPEVASVGLSEEQAKAEGIPVKCGKYLTGANGKCLIENTESGYVKLVAHKDTGVILGAQLVCPRATDLIGELAVAVQQALTANELSSVIHPHPTFIEMIHGAADLLRVE